MFQLVWEPINIRKIAEGMHNPENGAIITFEGVVRDNARGKTVRFLEYDAYEPMAKKKLEEIGELAIRQFEIREMAIVHRLGHMEVGECSTVIVVASAHRGPAFDACRFAIDKIKEIVPIWKKEFYEDGEVWIEGSH